MWRNFMMFNKFTGLLLGSALLLLASCAAESGWTPTVDPYGDPNAAMIGPDQQACRQLALQASGGPQNRAAEGAIVGGLLGAATGAAIGAAVGDPGTGAAIGAAAGGMSGATSQGLGSEEVYKRAFVNCMRQRGHNVIN